MEKKSLIYFPKNLLFVPNICLNAIARFSPCFYHCMAYSITDILMNPSIISGLRHVMCVLWVDRVLLWESSHDDLSLKPKQTELQASSLLKCDRRMISRLWRSFCFIRLCVWLYILAPVPLREVFGRRTVCVCVCVWCVCVCVCAGWSALWHLLSGYVSTSWELKANVTHPS